MARVKGGTVTRRKHKKVLKLAKGYWMSRSKQIKKAKEATLHAGAYAFVGRKQKKRNFRQLWIIRLSAALQTAGLKYNVFMHKTKENKVELDRKVMAQMATEYPKAFEKLISKIK